MKDFALDVWSDLRDRRLWPVAALLLLALVAVPAVLVKPAEESPSQDAGLAAPARSGGLASGQALLKASDGKPLVRISSLDKFTSKDPFKPIEKLKPIGGTDSLKPSLGGGGGTAGSPSDASLTRQGGGPLAGVPALRGNGGGDTGGGSGGGTTKPPTVKKYAYVVDLTFGEHGDARRYQSFSRLGMLPSQSSPLLVYLGVDGTGTHAAFLVDSTLDATGEGTCRPSESNCGVAYLEPGEKETFNDGEGHSYELVIDQIRRVRVDSGASSSKASEEKGAHSADGQPRRFLFPVLLDLETEAHR